ncbi:MAG: MmgE/PrpD family protein [Candidatus Parcubacteria bacterium]|nr:MmgE/PrpD family protein [Burkholderiales bacterium]
MGRGDPRFRGQGRLSHPDYLEQLAGFACRARFADLPAAVLQRARWVVADSLPVIAAGMQQAEMQALSGRHLAAAASGRSWVLGTRRRAGAMDAALLNGTAGTGLELNEGNLFAKGHPGIQVVPAAVALAQEIGASGEALLMAVVVGYEIGSRISRAAQVKISVHPHGTWGTLCAAVAAGRLQGFDQRRMRELINVASSMGMATSRQTLLDGATVRNIFTGHAGYMGLMAARLVECGFTGEHDSPASVYGKVLSDGFDPEKAVENLGSEWLLGRGYFKLHPTGRYVHSVIDALEDLIARHGRPDTASIERMEVKAYRLAAMLAEKRVTSSFGARFSIPFALATILNHGGSGLAQFEQAAVDNAAIQALAARVDVAEEAQYTARYPAEQICDLRIFLVGGKILDGRCTVTSGEPARPHAPKALEAKFMQLGVPVWGEEQARRLLKGCMTLEGLRDFARFSEGFDL